MRRSLLMQPWRLARDVPGLGVPALRAAYCNVSGPSLTRDSTRTAPQHHRCSVVPRFGSIHHNMIRGFWKSKRTPYDVLNVSRSATAKEIKLAFYREAKKYHPDLHPNDPKAKERFQEIASAYELLSDEKRRAAYNSTGYTGDSQSSQTQHDSQWKQQHAEDIFNSASADFDVIREALSTYGEEIRDEMNYTLDCISRRDWGEVWEVAKHNKLIILGVVVPSFMLLRYPPLVLAFLRLAWMGGQLAVAGLLYTGQLDMAARTLWRLIVRMSREKQERGKHSSRR